MLKIFKNMKKTDWIFVLFSAVFIVIQVWLDLTMPDYMSEITMLVQTPGSDMSDIWSAGIKMLLCALGSLAASVITSVFAAKIAADFGATLRSLLYDKVESFSMEEIGRFSTASLITRSTNDIVQIQMSIVMGLQVIVKAPITAVWAICKIVGKASEWTISTAAAVLILLLVVGVCLMLTVPKFKKLQTQTDNLNRVTRENLTGIKVIRAYNAEKYQENKFNKANDKLTETNLFTTRTMSFMMPSIQLVSNALSLAIYWIGAVIINQAGMNKKAGLFSDMVVFSSYALQIIMSFMMLVMIGIILPRAAVSAERINEVLDTEPTIEDGTLTKGMENIQGEIEFQNVSFKYPDAEEYVLENISFTAHKGETVAFIGSTGCGKSTVINLIPRFYDATDGKVLVDGVDVRDYKQQSLHNKIGYVSQKAIMFYGTINSNVAYGDNGKNNFTEQAVADAVETAQADDFVKNSEDKYKSFVAQGGENFSGGQKQRLSIARAVCRDPEIFIFDDSFSALDYKTDKKLRETLAEKCAGATKIIVAQRIGTIIDADKIIVLDEGRIVGKGKHSELMANCDVYRQIAYSQLSKEELA